MEPRKAALFALAQESEKQDRSDNVTGQRSQKNCNRGNQQSDDNQGSHGGKKGLPRRPVRGSEGQRRSHSPRKDRAKENAGKRQRPSTQKSLNRDQLSGEHSMGICESRLKLKHAYAPDLNRLSNRFARDLTNHRRCPGVPSSGSKAVQPEDRKGCVSHLAPKRNGLAVRLGNRQHRFSCCTFGRSLLACLKRFDELGVQNLRVGNPYSGHGCEC